jgi:hypothetical protein
MIKIWKLAVTNLIHILNMQVNILRYLLKKNSHIFKKIQRLVATRKQQQDLEIR